LINAFEVSETEPSTACTQVDIFPFIVAPTEKQQALLDRLGHTLSNGSGPTEIMNAQNEFSWGMLEGRLAHVSPLALQRSANRMARYPGFDTLTDNHKRTAAYVATALKTYGTEL
jgi:hypothetical protein